jgi:hypothetical protein
MLHLFNKTYLEFDDNVDINVDRVVISSRYGTPVLAALDRVAYGELISYGKTLDDVLSEGDFIDFIESLALHSNTSNKKFIIFCDKQNYNKFVSLWFKLILPNLDSTSFQSLIDLTLYKERITKNTQLSASGPMNISYLVGAFGDIVEVWEGLPNFTTTQKNKFKTLNLNLSYEFLLSSYFAGSTSYTEKLLKTAHLFLERWFKEALTDNRQMILINLTNHKILSDLGVDYSLVDITKENPLDGIEQFQYYADDEIWDRVSDASSGTYGICNLRGLSDDKLQGLKNTLIGVYSNAEGMDTNKTCFSAFDWIDVAGRDSMTQEELDSILEFLVTDPFDTCLVPRFDFQNVNFSLMLHILKLKKDGNTSELNKFKLL